MDKRIIRKVYLEKRKLLSKAEYERRNLLLCERLIQFVKEKSFKRIHVFFAIQKFKEVDLSHFISWAMEQTDMEVASSVSDLQQAKMHHFLIQKDTLFETNKWGIPEPVGAKVFDISVLDCVLVPMVIGSKTGQRIGYGKGYYDQFLVQCPSATTFVGLNLGPLLEGKIYAESHDIEMDYMLTPFQLFKVTD